MARTAERQNLSLFAGPRALEQIRDGGLPASSVATVLGAAGGPKWLVLAGLDRAVFFGWLTRPNAPVRLVGSSIGAWRFAAVAQGRRAAAAHETLEHAYINQRYDRKPSPQDITDEAVRILDEFLTDDGAASLLANPLFSLSVIAVRGRRPFFSGGRRAVAAGMLFAGVANAFSRNNLTRFFTRVVFTDPRDGGAISAAAFAGDAVTTESVALTGDNLRAAVLASGSIPVVMSPTTSIAGAAAGLYWDGGLVDYHVTIPEPPAGSGEGIILFPHYVDRIIPGWFDKHLPRRAPKPRALERVLLVAPSREFVGRLPYGKIPDRGDFKLMAGRDAERIAYWNRTAAESGRLGDEFVELAASGRIRQRVKPFPAARL